MANCFYEVTDIRRHPFNFATDTIIRQLVPYLRETPAVEVLKEAQKELLRQKFKAPAKQNGVKPLLEVES
jgi:hypothetical protein